MGSALMNGQQSHLGQGLASEAAAMAAAAAAGQAVIGGNPPASADPGSVNFAEMFKSMDDTAGKSTNWMLSQTLVQMQQQVLVEGCRKGLVWASVD